MTFDATGNYITTQSLYFSVFTHTQAVEYLNKVEGFKNFGFSEKKIHDAFEKSGQDWDKALDILTEDR